MFRWATCLLDSSEDLDTPNELKHERFGGAPGVVWGAKKQCEVCKRSSVLSYNLPRSQVQPIYVNLLCD